MTRRRLAWIGAAAVFALLTGALAARANLWYQTTDFFCFYQGARSLALGRDPYDENWWRLVTGALYPDPRFGLAASSCPGRFGYPLWTAVALLPLGVLPLEVAAISWEAIAVGATLAGAWAAWRAVGGSHRLAPLFGILVLSSQPFWILVISGQMSGVMLGLAGGLALFLARGRQTSAGIALAALALKPQIVVLVLPVALLRAIGARRVRLIGAAVATGAVMLVLPMGFVPFWPLEWLNEVIGRRLRVVQLLPTAWGLAGDVLGSSAFGAILVAVVVCAAWLLVRGRRLDDVGLLALTLPLSLFVTPYAWSYDFLVLAVPWAFILARADHAQAAVRTWLLLAVVALAGWLPWLLYAVAFPRRGEALSAVITAATALLVAATLRVGHHQAPSEGPKIPSMPIVGGQLPLPVEQNGRLTVLRGCRSAVFD